MVRTGGEPWLYALGRDLLDIGEAIRGQFDVHERSAPQKTAPRISDKERGVSSRGQC